MIHIRSLRKVFPPDTVALDDVSLDVAAGEFVMVIGQSGAGKTTLLRCLNRLEEPTAGEVFLNESRVTGASSEALRAARRQIGMIFQQFNLVRRASVLENVLAGRLGYVPALPSLLGRFPRKDRDLARGCLRLVGLEEFAGRRADTLSGGEQQRVAIARALAQEPKVILADEPTASLDPKLTESIMGILQRINLERRLSLVVSQHMLDTALTYGTRIVGLRRGRVVFDGPPGAMTPDRVADIYEGGKR
jgi:phosphonate transport system ATP-binding protein